MDLTKFECDGCGDVFGAKNDVVEFDVKSRWKTSPMSPFGTPYDVSYVDDDEDNEVIGLYFETDRGVGHSDVENGVSY